MSDTVPMRRWILVLCALSLAGAALFVVLQSNRSVAADVLVPQTSDPSLNRTRPVEGTNPESNIPGVAGLDLTRIAADDEVATAPAAEGRIARLTLDPTLQRTAVGLLAANRLPEAAIVMIDNATGRVLVYASHIEAAKQDKEKVAQRDLCSEATAPAASVFKIVTGATLVEEAHLSPDTNQCYNGGAERVTANDLIEDSRKDKWCATLAGAMGRSLNTVFARLAQRHLRPAQLEAMARRFGFGEPVPFDVPVQPSAVHIPEEPLEFARTAAGFWNSTMSPLEAAWLSSSVARGGEALRPMIVRDVRAANGAVLYAAPPAPVVRRIVKPETAQALTTMMEHTVNEGTSYRAFHDDHGHAFLPDISVAGKTGTLSDSQANRFYTWFTGFAPSRPIAGTRSVSIAVLVVNQPTWQVKANVVARDMLRAYFATQNAPHVTKPQLTAIAKHRRAMAESTR